MDSTFSQTDVIRTVPASVDAEQALLGAILIDSQKLDEVASILSVDDFYIEANGAIYAAALALHQIKPDVDAVMILEELKKNGVFQEKEGYTYLTQLAESTPSVSNVRDYATIIRDKSLLRRLIKLTEEIRNEAFEQSQEAKDILQDAERLIFELTQGYVSSEFVTIDQAFVSLFARLRMLRENKGALGIKTHYSQLDEVLNGLEEGDLVLVGARPGMGKTSFVLNIATNVARHIKSTVAIFSLEMSTVQIASRILSSEARVSSSRMRRGDLNDEDFAKFVESTNALCHNHNILIDDTAGITVTDMRSKLRRVKNLGLVVVDYLQLMRGHGKRYDNKVNEVADITWGLKMMAKELKVPVLLCSQLSRSNEKSTGGQRRPQASDLRDSGAIEQDADMILLLYNPEHNNPDLKGQSGYEVECIVAKNRHGATKTVKLYWEGEFTRFSTVEHTYENEAPPA
ncbi:MAG: replicative DNA helicase [Clostridia bacterium]|nr:replicative DNA helicase [Clostridia bacterium]